MALEDLFIRKSVKDIINSKLIPHNLPFSRKSIDKLIDLEEVVKPIIYDHASDASKNSYVAYLINNLADKILIIPYNYDIIDMPPIKQRKKGETLKLKRCTESDVLNCSLKPKELFIKALNNLVVEKNYSGYEWQGTLYTDRAFRIVPLVEIIQALKIYLNSKLTSDKSEKIELKEKVYVGNGRYCFVNALVPSVSKKDYNNTIDKRFVALERVALKEKSKNKISASWMNLSAKSKCPEHEWQFHFGRYVNNTFRKGNEKIFCSHEIAAFFHLISYLNNFFSDYAVAYNPFFIPDKNLFMVYKKLTEQVVKEFIDDKGKARLRILNNSEVESLIWLCIAREYKCFDKTIKGEEIYKKYFSTKDISFYVE